MKGDTMNREQRPAALFRSGLPVLLCFGLSGCLVGCTDSQALAPKPSSQPAIPPLPVARQQVTVVAQQDNRVAMAMTPINTNAAPAINISEAFPSAPASLPPPKRGAVTLAWDASPDASVVGYRVYYGTESGRYTQSATISNAVGMATTFSARITGLDEGTRYYFAASAFDASGVESVLSNEAVGTTAHYINLRQFAYAVEAFGVYGKTNEIKMSTNLLSWWTVMTFVGDGSLKTYVHTNAAQAWFKVTQ